MHDVRAALHVFVQGLGIWLIARAVAGIDALELAGVRQVRLPTARALQTAHHETGGVYGLVRHPLYLGWTLLVFGAAHMTGDRLIFAAINILYLTITIP